MNFLSKEMIKAAQGRRFDVFDIPDVGPVRIGAPSSRQADALKKIGKRREQGEDVELEIMAIALECVVDGDGRRVFSAEEIEQKLGEWSMDSLSAIVMAIYRLATPAGAQETGTPAGNSEPSPSAS